MTSATHDMLRAYATKRWPAATHQYRIWRLKDLLNWTERRTRALYNNEDGMRVRADEMAALEALTLKESQDEFQALEARIAQVEALLFTNDPEHTRPQVDAIREQAFRHRYGPKE